MIIISCLCSVCLFLWPLEHSLIESHFQILTVFSLSLIFRDDDMRWKVQWNTKKKGNNFTDLGLKPSIYLLYSHFLHYYMFTKEIIGHSEQAVTEGGKEIDHGVFEQIKVHLS